MAESSGNKLCPICDSPLQPGSKKCGFCGTDLSIFDIETELPKEPEPVVTQAAPKVSVESRIEEIFSKPLVQERPPVREQPKPTPPTKVEESTRRPEPVRISPPETAKPEPKAEPKPAAPVKSAEYFECPECGTSVETSATSCPKCGVLFAEEGAEMFQCPACNTLVSVDATSCPGCGAIFVEPDAQAAPEAEKPKIEIEPAVEQVKPAPEPVKVEKMEEPEAKPEEGEKKGFMRWFKRGKKEEKESESKDEPERVKEPETPKPAPAHEPSPTVRIEPTRPVKPHVSQEVQIREAEPEAAVEAIPVAQVKPKPAPTPASITELSQGKDKGRDLARMVAEMKPLLALAREKDVDIGDSKGLIDEAATAGRERHLDRAIELVQESKNMLLAKVDAQLSDQIMKLNDEIKIAREFGGDISKATMYIQEVAKARGAGDIEAAFVYADKVKMELLPITGRYNDSKRKIATAKQLVADCEAFIVDTREARRILVEANKAFDSKDFDKVDTLVRTANDSLAKVIPTRMNEEIASAKELLIEAKTRNVNISPMITVLKSATSLMKSGDYGQAVKEMREFKEMIRKAK